MPSKIMLNLIKASVCLLFLLLVFSKISFSVNMKNIYFDKSKASLDTHLFVDKSIPDGNTIVQAVVPFDDTIFHLFSHGKPGYLFLENQWLNPQQIESWFKRKSYLKSKQYLNIYGCEFAKGKIGKAAVRYLEESLGISIAASDDITGVSGDWNLEVGESQYSLAIVDYFYNLQCGNISSSCVLPSSTTSNDGSITISGINTIPNAAWVQIWIQSVDCGINWYIAQDWTNDLSDKVFLGLDDCHYEFSIYVDDASNNNICVDYRLEADLHILSCSSNSPVCAGERLLLNAFLVGGVSWSWSGPNGFSSTDPNVELSDFGSANVGTYNVIVTNVCGTQQTCSLDVTLSTSCSSQSCSCSEYVYVNDWETNITHKFEVQANGDLVEVGSPWLPYNGSQIDAPHGVAIDPNGFIYISELHEANYVQLDCDGNITNMQAENTSGFSHVIVGEYMYIVTDDFVEVYNLCDGSLSFVGWVSLGNAFANTEGWGIAYNENDGLLYVTDNYVSAGGQLNPGEGDIYAIDPSDPETAGSIWQMNSTINPILSGFDILMGITFDDDNNMYFVEQTVFFANSEVHKYTWNGTTWVAAGTVADNSFDTPPSGFYNAWGITWSSTADKLYVTSFDEDCVAAFDATTLTYEGAAVPHVPNASAKAIGLIEECCYYSASTIDLAFCPEMEGEKVLLRDLLNCQVCGGSWTRTSGTGGIYDACSQTFEIDATTTNTQFEYMAQNEQCGSVTVTVNITIEDFTIGGTSTNACGSMGSIDVNILTGGAPAYTYDWSADTLDGIEDPTGLSVGTYSVTVTDIIGCTATASFNILSPPTIICLPLSIIRTVRN